MPSPLASSRTFEALASSEAKNPVPAVKNVRDAAVLAAYIASYSPFDGIYQSLFPPDAVVTLYAKPDVQPASIVWVFAYPDPIAEPKAVVVNAADNDPAGHQATDPYAVAFTSRYLQVVPHGEPVEVNVPPLA